MVCFSLKCGVAATTHYCKKSKVGGIEDWSLGRVQSHGILIFYVKAVRNNPIVKLIIKACVCKSISFFHIFF